MIDPAYVRTLARYSRWQNESLYAAAATLTDAQRREDRGAFFKSIHATLNHLLFGDSIWMSRFLGAARPEGVFPGTDYCADWDDLRRRRAELDEKIVRWAEGLDGEAIAGELEWNSGLQNMRMSKPRWLAVTHFFNHQTHHRGQVHAMLTAASVDPGSTDLMFMPETVD